MDSPSMDSYLSVANLYQQLDALVPMNSTTPLGGSENDCLAILTSARSARDVYLNQRDSSHQDVVAAQEHLKLHEARLQHFTATVNAVDSFIGEARSRLRARGIPVYPIFTPPNVNLVTPPDPASRPDDTNVPFTAPSEHIQGSAGGPLGVTSATSEKSTLRRSGRLAPSEGSPLQTTPRAGCKRPQEDTSDLNPMAPNKKSRPTPTRKLPSKALPKAKANQQQPQFATNTPTPSSTEHHGLGQQAAATTSHHPERLVVRPPSSLNFTSQGFSINTPPHSSNRLPELTTNQSLISRAYPSPVSMSNNQPSLTTTRPIPVPVDSVDPSGFSHSVDPSGFSRPVNSSGYPYLAHPSHPAHPVHPAHPIQPAHPVHLTHPIHPAHPVHPTHPIHPPHGSHNSYPHPPHPATPSPHHGVQPLRYPQRAAPRPTDLPPPALPSPSHVRSTAHAGPTQQSASTINAGRARSPPNQEAEAEVIDVDEHEEDENSNLSDGEDEEDPNNVIEMPATDGPPPKGGIKFSPVAVDVLEQHWKKNGRPKVLPVRERSKFVHPDRSSDSRRFYQGDWADVLDLARSLVLSKILLEHAFPVPSDLEQDSTECLMEAVATIRKRPSVKLDDEFLEEHRSSMVKLVLKQPTTYRGQLRDHVRVLVRDEVANAINDAPPARYIDGHGRLRKVPEDNETVVRDFISNKLSASRFLDGLWEKLFGGRDIDNSLNSPLLRAAVIRIYDHHWSQEALRVSPSEETLDRLPIVPGDPGYHAHWSKVPPPRLVALAATILQVCYEEWKSGTYLPIDLRGSDYFTVYDDIFELIYSEWSHKDRRDAVRERFAGWARTSSMKLKNTA